MSFTNRVVSFLALFAAIAAAHAEAPVAVQSGLSSPHAAVIRHMAWDREAGAPAVTWVGAGQASDVSVVPAGVAVARRSAGEDLKVVYVVSRDANGFNVLVVSQRTLTERREPVEQVLAWHERARRWMLDNPTETARVVAQGAGIPTEHAAAALSGQEFYVARPGPALAQALKAGGADATLVGVLIDDAPMRAAVRRVEHARPAQVQVPVAALR
ncbi:MAG: hypothetical protein JNM79_24455 [Burkholderiales bacterium]|nr:hypothetical protein [Burkholderiales bacterium]